MKLKYGNKFIHLSFSFWLKYILFTILYSLLVPNIILTFLSLIILPIIIKLVWRPNEPPVFVLILIFHWLQISTKIFHANFKDVTIQQISFSSSTDTAIYLSLIGLFSLSLGINLMIRNIDIIDRNIMIEQIYKFSITKVLFIYLLFNIYEILIYKYSQLIPSLSAILYTAKSFKLIFLYLFFLLAIVNKKYFLLFLVLVIETLLGFSGFFSSFKTVYFILILAYFTINPSISIKKVIIISPIFLFLILLVTIWSAIKMDYRKTISLGSATQSVQVSTSKQIDTYYKLLSSLDSKKISLGMEALAYRLEYIEFFSQTINYVPKFIEHENGKLWLDAYINLFKPRFFFPDKGILDDSRRTSKYTGVWHPDGDDGVSISLGYFAESYIDFGYYFMFLPILLLGIIFGWIYKYYIKLNQNIILSYSFIVLVLHGHYLLEKRNDKIIGGLFIMLILVYILKKNVFRKIFNFMEKK